MTQEEAKKWKNEIAAFAEGKTIQYKDLFCKEWTDNDEPNFKLDCFYRIKPESTKRLPTIEEVEQWFMDNKVFKGKTVGGMYRISSIEDKTTISIADAYRNINEFCTKFTHLDGSELYITE